LAAGTFPVVSGFFQTIGWCLLAGKLGDQKQGPGLSAIFNPSSRMRMSSDDTARLPATNDMNNLLLSMINQGATPPAAAADVPASMQQPAAYSSSYPMQGMQQQAASLPAPTLDTSDPSMSHLMTQYSANAVNAAVPDFSSYGMQLPNDAQNWDASLPSMDAQSSSVQYELPPQFNMPPQIKLESAPEVLPLQVQQLQEQQQQEQLAQQKLQEHQQMQQEQELLQQQQMAQQEQDQQQQQQFLLEEQQLLQEDVQQDVADVPPVATQEFDTLFSAMLGGDSSSSSSSAMSDEAESSKPAPAAPTPVQQPAQPAPAKASASSTSSSSTTTKPIVGSVPEQQRMPATTQAPLSSENKQQQQQQTPAQAHVDSSSSHGHADSETMLAETVGFLPTPANSISSSDSSSSSSNDAETNTEEVTDVDDSALLEFAAGAPDQPGIEVDLIPTDPSDDLYVPAFRSARSELDKVHSASAGLMSTRQNNKSPSASMALVPPQKQQPKLAIGAIAGIVAGGAVVLVVLALFLARTVYHIRARQASKQSTDRSSAAGSNASSHDADGDTPRSTVDIQHFYTQYSVDLEGGAEASEYAAPAAAALPTAASSPACHQRSHDGAGSSAAAAAATANWWRVVKTRSSSNSSGKGSGANSPVAVQRFYRDISTPCSKQNKGL
jgi:hypothetical protein